MASWWGTPSYAAVYQPQPAPQPTVPRGRIKYPWAAQAANQLTVRAGQIVLLLDSTSFPGWIGCQIEGTPLTGYIPDAYVQQLQAPIYPPYGNPTPTYLAANPAISGSSPGLIDVSPTPVASAAPSFVDPVARPQATPTPPPSTTGATRPLGGSQKMGNLKVQPPRLGSKSEIMRPTGEWKEVQQQMSNLAIEAGKEKERRKYSDTSRTDLPVVPPTASPAPVHAAKTEKKYALWVGNPDEYDEVAKSASSKVTVVSLPRTIDLLTWFSTHETSVAPENVRLVTSRFRIGDGDENAASLTVGTVRRNAKFGKIPVLVFCGSVQKVTSLWAASPPTFISNDQEHAIDFCSFREVAALLVAPSKQTTAAATAPPPHAKQNSEDALPIRPAAAAATAATGADDAEQLWNDLDYQEEQAALSEDERFAELHKSAMVKSERRKTASKMNMALLEARSKLAAEKLSPGAPLPTVPLPTVAPPAVVSLPVLPAARPPKGGRRRKSASINYCYESSPLTSVITDSIVKDLMNQFTSNRVLGYDSAHTLITEIINLFKNAANVQRVSVPSDGDMTVVGDLHGQLADLVHILRTKGLPTSRNLYLFNGDFVDRGANSCEVLFLLLALKLQNVNSVFLNRGNHESRAMNAKYTFEEEVIKKYDKKLFSLVVRLFELMPICTTIDARTIVLHGGLSAEPLNMNKLEAINRQKQPLIGKARDPLDKIFTEILWSDPRVKPGIEPSRRGAGIYWGADVTDRFLSQNHFELLVRSHEVIKDGACYSHPRCLTVFSASNYCGKQKNMGAYLVFTRNNPKPSICTFRVGSTSDEGSAKAKEDLILQLADKIFAHRARLRAHWGSVRKISTQQWDEGMTKVLRIQMEWSRVREDLCHVSRSGQVNVDEFLKIYQLRLSPHVQELYDSSSTLKRIIEDLYAQRVEAKRLFRSLDTNGDGLIDEDEFVAGLEALGLIPEEDDPPPDVFVLFKLFDTDNSGDVDYAEFEAFLNSVQLARITTHHSHHHHHRHHH